MAEVTSEFKWLRTGDEALSQMLDAISGAKKTVRLEMYIFHTGPVADKFRDALLHALHRGLEVRVMFDALGSAYLPDSYWHKFREMGGEFRWFNPISLKRIFIRDHRKLLVVDEDIAFVGGFNIATEYCGDGVHEGWRDLGMKLRGPLTQELARAFDDMFNCADFKHKPFIRLRKSARAKIVAAPEARLLLGGPASNSPLKRSVATDLNAARDVLIVTPYFVPTLKIRRVLKGLARKGATVKLILPGKSDLPVVRMAGQSFYRRFMKAGVEIYEYQPRILHAKLFVIDEVAYVGSANLDKRSMNVNYELMVRVSNPAAVQEARQIFDEMLVHCRRITPAEWRASRTFLDRVRGHIAHFLIARLDSFFASRQMRWWKFSLRKVKAARHHKTADETH